jgi:hypothetical protein
MAALFALFSGPVASAQNATTFDGNAEASGQSYAHSFTVTPGVVNADISATTDYGSSLLRLIIRGQDQRELANVTVPASSSGARKTLSFKVDRGETLEAQVLMGLDVGVRVKYDLTLRQGASAPPARPSVPQPAAEPPVAPLVEAPATPVETTGAVDLVSAPVEDKWALIVGVSKFQRAEANLKFAAKDASDFRDFLVNEAHFAPDHVKLIVDENATKERVLAEIGDKWLPRLARPNDLVVIFISTHGSQSSLDLEGINYLVMHNTDPDSLYATGLPLQELASAIKQRVHARRVVLIIDACHSGAANPTKGLTRQPRNIDSAALSAGSGQLVICSSQPTEVSWESKRYPNSVFTGRLIEALRAGSGKLPLTNAFSGMKEAVTSEVLSDRKELQTPVLKTNWKGGDVILTAPPLCPRPVPPEVK